MPDEFTWVLCPNCSNKLFKAIETVFTVEIPCNGCKGIYELTSDGTQVCHKEVRKPKRLRTNTQYPTHQK